MSKKEARKITIIEELLAGRFTNHQAAELLDLSVRQVQRMKKEASINGVMSILHKNRGRKPANALDPEVASTTFANYVSNRLSILYLGLVCAPQSRFRQVAPSMAQTAALRLHAPLDAGTVARRPDMRSEKSCK